MQKNKYKKVKNNSPNGTPQPLAEEKNNFINWNGKPRAPNKMGLTKNRSP